MLYLLSASLIWAFSYGLIKSELTTLDPNFVTVFRMMVAFLVFLPFSNFKKNKSLAPYLLGIGALQYGVMYLCVLRAYQYLDAYQVVLFTASTPFYIILFNTLLERRFTAYHFMVAAIAMLGGGIIYKSQFMNPHVFVGFLLVQASDICFAFGQMYYRKLRKNYPNTHDKETHALLFLGAIMISILSTTCLGGWHSMYDMTLRQGFILMYLGLIPSGLCFFWWNKGATQTPPVIFSVCNNLKLPLGTLISLVFFHEHIEQSMHLTAGLLLIVFALFLAYRYSTRLSGVTDESKQVI